MIMPVIFGHREFCYIFCFQENHLSMEKITKKSLNEWSRDSSISNIEFSTVFPEMLKI